MLTLEKKITLNDWINFFSIRLTEPEKAVLEANGIVYLEDLKKYIEVKPLRSNSNFMWLFEYISEKIEKLNLTYKKESQGKTVFHDLYGIDQSSLNLTEKRTTVEDLILEPIVIQGWRVTFINIKKFNIETLRLCLSYKNKFGKPLLQETGHMGVGAVLKIKKAIELYEEQILRVSLESPLEDTDLFSLNRKEKREIVIEELKDYVTYLENYASSCIWGKLTSNQIELLHNAIEKSTTESLENRERMIKLFSDYMTLGELKNNVIESEVFEKRFIQRNRK